MYANAITLIHSPDNSGHVQVARNLPADCKGENAAVHAEDSNPRWEKGGSFIGIVWGRGRHDPCVLSPAVTMVEAMESCFQMRIGGDQADPMGTTSCRDCFCTISQDDDFTVPDT
eukprot:scaffold21415_cov57-Cyclotella_meneghiniana.AAC.3